MKFKEQGIIIFDPKNYTKKHNRQSTWKNTVIINLRGEICDYYAWLIQRRFGIRINVPLRLAHVTIINDKKDEGDENMYNYAKTIWHKQRTEIEYDPKSIYTNGEHWWLDVSCADAAKIRKQAGYNEKYIYD